MNCVKIGIILGGILSFVIFIFHTRFHRFFAWQKDFEKISPLNRRVLCTIHLALYLLVALLGFLSIVFAEELSRGEGLAAGLTAGYSLFWLWRAVWQITYFKPLLKTAERSRRFVHYALTTIFIVLFIVYLLPVTAKLMNMR